MHRIMPISSTPILKTSEKSCRKQVPEIILRLCMEWVTNSRIHEAANKIQQGHHYSHYRCFTFCKHRLLLLSPLCSYKPGRCGTQSRGAGNSSPYSASRFFTSRKPVQGSADKFY